MTCTFVPLGTPVGPLGMARCTAPPQHSTFVESPHKMCVGGAGCAYRHFEAPLVFEPECVG